MNRYTVTIQHSHYGTWDYYGQPEEYLINNEEQSTIQILRVILTNLIFYKVKLNGKFYETVKDKALMIKEIYQTIKKENYFEISYWSSVNWSETTIGIEKTRKVVLIMSKYTVTIENLLHGNNSCLKQEKILIKEEEKTTNQILDLLLRYPIFLFDLKINSKPALAYTYPWPPMPR